MDVNAKAGLDLTGKVVVITGGSRGIGAETARRMAAADAQVIINYHSSDAAANHPTPIMKSRLRPYRSPSEPPMRISELSVIR